MSFVQRRKERREKIRAECIKREAEQKIKQDALDTLEEGYLKDRQNMDGYDDEIEVLIHGRSSRYHCLNNKKKPHICRYEAAIDPVGYENIRRIEELFIKRGLKHLPQQK